MSIKITGLNELQRKLRTLSSRASAMNGTHSVRLDELFPPAFLLRHSQFKSVEDMFAKSGFKVETQDDIKAIPDEEWDRFIANRTKFGKWKEMQLAATAEWTKKKLGL